MILDEGYQYGLGVFETLAVYNGKAIFLKEHIKRLNKSLGFLGINKFINEDDINPYLTEEPLDYYGLKILVSEKNLIIIKREIPYKKSDYDRGFIIDFSRIRSNQTSPFVYHKTFNYGECIMEKRNASKMGLDDMLFLNWNKEICEATTCNIFFVKSSQIFTPQISCGILPGIIRDYICQNFDVVETIITPADLPDYDECFVTNSLMGVMPVQRLAEKSFVKRDITDMISDSYFKNILGLDYLP
ncbi:MAG: aminotransferase class IV [Clostridiales bacterium]|nr:aminotransferase class IV [Clostridiales bacterium]